MKKHQLGFKAIEILLLVLFIGTISTASWYLLSDKNQATDTLTLKALPSEDTKLVIIEDTVILQDEKGWTHQKRQGSDSIVGTLSKSNVSVTYDYGMYGRRPSETATQLDITSRNNVTYALFKDTDTEGESLVLIAYREADKRQYFAGSIRQTDETAIEIAKNLLSNLALL